MERTSLLARLMLRQKFALLGIIGVLLVSVPFYLYFSQANKEIEATILKTKGIKVSQSLLNVVQFTQQHRGLSAAVLGGTTALQAQREAKQSETGQAYGAMDTIVKHEVNDRAATAAWEQAHQNWETLRSKIADRSMTVQDSYLSHTSLTAELLLVNDLLADYFGLSMNPDPYAYHMTNMAVVQGPSFTEDLGRTRAKGAGILAQKAISPGDRTLMSAQVARAKERLQTLERTFAKATALNPALKEKLDAPMGESVTLAKKAIQLAEENIVNADQMAFPPSEYIGLFTQAIDSQFRTNGIAMAELEIYLDSSVAGLTMGKYMLAGSVFALALLCGLIGYIITRSITRPLADAVVLANRVADGDLTSNIEVTSKDETGQMLAALMRMNKSLKKIVSKVRDGTDTITTASRQIASGNADLSQRTEEQASNLEETASSMEEMTSTVKQNAENARQANQLAVNASNVAIKGGQVVGEAVQTMASISDSSKRIVDIIGVIEGIAFQTNILALNAAVEAARAGEQGRGFAVVASEVRTLAQRSAAAAKEIKALIGDSVDKVNAGSRQVDQAGTTMSEIVSAVKRVTDIMSEISAASNEQSAGIEQVNLAIMQMDKVTQQNAALVEEASAAAESMEEQANTLLEVMSIFKLEAARGDAWTAVAKPVIAQGASTAMAIVRKERNLAFAKEGKQIEVKRSRAIGSDIEISPQSVARHEHGATAQALH